MWTPSPSRGASSPRPPSAKPRRRSSGRSTGRPAQSWSARASREKNWTAEGYARVLERLDRPARAPTRAGRGPGAGGATDGRARAGVDEAHVVECARRRRAQAHVAHRGERARPSHPTPGRSTSLARSGRRWFRSSGAPTRSAPGRTVPTGTWWWTATRTTRAKTTRPSPLPGRHAAHHTRHGDGQGRARDACVRAGTGRRAALRRHPGRNALAARTASAAPTPSSASHSRLRR
jgi:hypothetical protein